MQTHHNISSLFVAKKTCRDKDGEYMTVGQTKQQSECHEYTCSDESVLECNKTQNTGDNCNGGCFNIESCVWRNHGEIWENETARCNCDNGDEICKVFIGNWTMWGEWTRKCPEEGGGSTFRYRECQDKKGDTLGKAHCPQGEEKDKKECSNTIIGIARAGVRKRKKIEVISGDAVRVRDLPLYSMVVSLSTNVTDDGHSTGHFCGGIILTDKYVLTAAHCPCGGSRSCCDFAENGKVKLNTTRCDPANWKITAGETERNPTSLQGQQRAITKVIVHRNYTLSEHGNPNFNDVALIRIDEPFNFTDTIQPSWLPSSVCSKLMDSDCEEHLQLADNQACKVAGWGTSGDLRTLTTLVNSWDNETFKVTSTGVLYEQPCEGDSGGPLLCVPNNEDFHVAVGIMSYLDLETGCGKENFGKTLHSSIPHFLGWMHNQLIGRGDGNSKWDKQFSEYPWIASIWKNISYVGEPSGYACGGIIITDIFVLTSSHCLCLKENYCCNQNNFDYDKCDLKDWWVQVGQCKLEDPENPFLRKISKIFIHESYDEFNTVEETRLNDIALIVLKDPLPLHDPDVDTARIPTSECTNIGATGGNCTEHKLEDCEFASCGESPDGNGSSDTLKVNELNVTFVSENMLITESEAKDAPCKGDAGSPLICKGEDNKNVAFGVISQPYTEATACTDETDGETFITPIASFLEWINEKIGEENKWSPWGSCSVKCSDCQENGKCPTGVHHREKRCEFPLHGQYRKSNDTPIYQKFDADCYDTQSGACTPKCIKKCPGIEKTEGLVVTGGPKFKEGKTAVFSCKDGYELKGPSQLKCSKDGKWPSNQPTCELLSEKRGCPTIGVTNGLIVLGGSNVGQTAKFRCMDGYVRNGPRQITCNDDEKWSLDPPTCEEDGFCLDISLNIEDPRLVIRGKPPYKLNDNVKFRCKPTNRNRAAKFEKVVPEKLKCGPGGVWIDKGKAWDEVLPSCEFTGSVASGCRKDKIYLPLLKGIETRGKPKVCLDLVIMLDISCGIRDCTRDRLKAAASTVAKALLASSRDTVRIGLMAYAERVTHIIPLDNKHPVTDLLDLIDKMNTTSPGCRTYTQQAFRDVQTNYFNNAQPAGYKQVLHLYTDGRTFEERLQSETISEAKMLKQKGVFLNVIAVPNKFGRNGTFEFENLPTSSKYLFNVTQGDVTRKLYSRIVNDAPCP